jgi:hypothetical protein
MAKVVIDKAGIIGKAVLGNRRGKGRHYSSSKIIVDILLGQYFIVSYILLLYLLYFAKIIQIGSLLRDDIAVLIIKSLLHPELVGIGAAGRGKHIGACIQEGTSIKLAIDRGGAYRVIDLVSKAELFSGL